MYTDRNETTPSSKWRSWLQYLQVSEAGFPFSVWDYLPDEFEAPISCFPESKRKQIRQERKKRIHRIKKRERYNMKSLKDQLIEKGLAKEPEKKEGVVTPVTGELEVHQQDVVGTMRKAIYHPRQKLWDHKERHGRTITTEVKKIMEEKNIPRDTKVYKLIAMLRKATVVMNVREIHETFKAEVDEQATHAGVQQIVSLLYRSGVLVAESVSGSVGLKYKIANPVLTADEVYIKFVEWQRNLREVKRAANPSVKPEKIVAPKMGVQNVSLDFRGLQDALKMLKGIIPDTITINHRIEVVFTTEKKGKK